MSVPVDPVRGRLSWSALAAALAGTQAFSPVVCGWWLLLGVVRALIVDWMHDYSWVSAGFVPAVLTVVVGGLALILARALRRASKALASRAGQVGFTIGLYCVCGLAAAVPSALADPRLDVSAMLLIQRVCLSVAGLAAITYVVDQRQRQLAAVGRLIGQRRRLAAQRARHDHSLHELHQRLIATVNGTAGAELVLLNQSIQTIEQSVPVSRAIRQVATEVRNCAVEVVRGLSHVLDATSQVVDVRSALEDVEVDLEPHDLLLLRRGRRSDWRQLLARLFIDRPFQPTLLALFAFIASFLVAARGWPPAAALLISLVMGSVTLIILWACDRWLSTWVSRQTMVLRVTVVLLANIVSALAATLLVSAVLDVRLTQIAMQLSIGLMVCSGGIAVLQAVADERASVLRELSSTLEAISWESSRLQHDELSMRKEVAALLHSDIQGRLTAVAAVLDNQAAALECGEQTQRQTREVLRMCSMTLQQTHRQLESLETSAHTGGNLVTDVESVASAWSEVMAIDVIWEPGAMDVIESSRAVSKAVVGVIREGLTNSLRHGNASHVQVRIAFSAASVHIVMTDNGDGLRADFVPGLGLRSMIRDGASIHLDNAGGAGAGTELSVRLPVVR